MAKRRCVARQLDCTRWKNLLFSFCFGFEEFLKLWVCISPLVERCSCYETTVTYLEEIRLCEFGFEGFDPFVVHCCHFKFE